MLPFILQFHLMAQLKTLNLNKSIKKNLKVKQNDYCVILCLLQRRLVTSMWRLKVF